MAINQINQFSFCRGDTPTIPLKIKTGKYSYVFTTTGIVTAPAVGDIYIIGDENFYVYAINGNDISCFSNLATDTLSATGTLTRATGTGDTSISYTAKTSSLYVDLTGLTIRFTILTSAINEPTGGQILLAPQTMTINGENAFVTLTSTQTLALPVAKAMGFFEIKNGSNYITETLDTGYLLININKEKIQP